MTQPTELERTSLEAHVDLCALRYGQLEEKIDKIETKIDLIEAKLDQFKTDIAWMIIKGGAGIILFLLGAIGTILKVLGHF
jgi:hypothetical protein